MCGAPSLPSINTAVGKKECSGSLSISGAWGLPLLQRPELNGGRTQPAHTFAHAQLTEHRRPFCKGVGCTGGREEVGLGGRDKEQRGKRGKKEEREDS